MAFICTLISSVTDLTKSSLWLAASAGLTLSPPAGSDSLTTLPPLLGTVTVPGAVLPLVTVLDSPARAPLDSSVRAEAAGGGVSPLALVVALVVLVLALVVLVLALVVLVVLVVLVLALVVLVVLVVLVLLVLALVDHKCPRSSTRWTRCGPQCVRF